jgi:hypothetical protein
MHQVLVFLFCPHGALLVLRNVRINLRPIPAYMCHTQTVCPCRRSIEVDHERIEGSIAIAKNALPQEVEAMTTMVIRSVNKGQPDHVQTMNLVEH